MPLYRISEAGRLLGVSDDTVRRWIDSGRLPATTDGGGRRAVEGVDLAALAQSLGASSGLRQPGDVASARNRFLGLVTNVVTDTVMAQVELQCGPYRVVSLMSREAAEELGLAAGVTAVASVKSTAVVVELPR